MAIDVYKTLTGNLSHCVKKKESHLVYLKLTLYAQNVFFSLKTSHRNN